jgi:hydrogenase nickel incorporation protein HypA/HybF
MHEVGIMQNTLNMALKQAQASGATQVHELRMRIGAMSGVVPDALTFAFEVLRKDTLAAEAKLEIETVPASCWCVRCQTEFPVPDLIYECPQCHEPSVELRRGLELELVSIEVS